MLLFVPPPVPRAEPVAEVLRAHVPPLVAALCASFSLVAASARSMAAPPMEIRKDVPCDGCISAAPSEAGSPRPLLVALHGDEGGDPRATSRLFEALRPSCEQAGVMLLALRCPREKGCHTGSFWQWRSSAAHDPGWIGAQIDALAARVPVDRERVYAAGYSGGASYLGWYVPTFPARFAAAAHLAGGVAWGTPCPRCKVPVLFLLGRGDPMLVPYTRPLRDYYEGCGEHEVVWETLPGVSHEGLLGVVHASKGASVVRWLLEHRARCGAEVEARDGGASEAANDAGSVGESVDAGATSEAARGDDPGLAEAARDAGARTPVPPSLRPPSTGCACSVERGDGAPERVLVAAMAALSLRRRRRAHSL
jgi:polyhydroxybutyrate depolymerase